MAAAPIVLQGCILVQFVHQSPKQKWFSSMKKVMHHLITMLLAIFCSNSFAQRIIPLYVSKIKNQPI